MSENGTQPEGDIVMQVVVQPDGRKRLSVDGNGQEVTYEHVAQAAFMLDELARTMYRAALSRAVQAGSAAAPIIPIRGNVEDAVRGLD